MSAKLVRLQNLKAPLLVMFKRRLDLTLFLYFICESPFTAALHHQTVLRGAFLPYSRTLLKDMCNRP